MFTSSKLIKYKPVIIRSQILVPRRIIIQPIRKFNLKANILLDSTKIIGDGIIYFTMIYCGLNWIYYRTLNSKKKDE